MQAELFDSLLSVAGFGDQLHVRFTVDQRRDPLAEHATDEDLTSREIDVLRLIAAGNANKVIAGRLSITEETVKSHVTNILAKLGANDRTHAVTIGLKRGLIEL